MQQNKKLQGILNGTCPRCRNSKMFLGQLYSSNSLRMEEECHHCNLQYEIEPGFFWGAMFFNYAFVVAIFLIETALLYMMGIMDTVWLYIVSPVTCIVLLPPIFRYSRILFLHLFGGIKFDQNRV